VGFNKHKSSLLTPHASLLAWSKPKYIKIVVIRTIFFSSKYAQEVGNYIILSVCIRCTNILDNYGYYLTPSCPGEEKQLFIEKILVSK
jgi:hypothetical protein